MNIFNASLITNNTLSGSLGNTFAQFSGSFSGSFQGNGSTLSVLSSSYAISASYAPSTGGTTPSLITPSILIADQDDYNPTGFSSATIVRLSSDSGSRAITSFVSASNGTEKVLINTGSFMVYFPGQHPDGTSWNRIITPNGDFYLHPRQSAKIVYDTLQSRWLLQPYGADDFVSKVLVRRVVAGASTTAQWGELTFNTGGGSVSVGGSSATVASSWDISTSTSSTGAVSIILSRGAGEFFYFGGQAVKYSAHVSIPTLSDGTQRFGVSVDLTNDTTNMDANTPPQSTCGIRYSDNVNSGKWQCFSRDQSNVETTADSGITVVATTPYELMTCVDRSLSEIRYYINGEFVARITANLPSSINAGSRVAITKSVGTTSRSLYVHGIYCEIILA